MNPFQIFEVRPAYGRIEAVIRWKLAAGVTGDVYFYRSESGVPGSWELLNPDEPWALSEGEFLDTTPRADMFSFVYYRGLVDPGAPPEGWLKGPSIRATDTYARREYMIAREVLRREYNFMRNHDGLRCFHLVQREKGAAAAGMDPETGQQLGPGCPDDPAQGFTTSWAGGFYEPVQTWAMFYQLSPKDHKLRDDAMGMDEESNVVLRLLAYPRPNLGNLIVFPESDRRYAVADPITPYYLRGNLPLIWEVNCQKLDDVDMRYKIVMPDLLPDPA